MIDKYQLDDLRLRSDEKGELARWVIQLQSDLDDERRKSSANQALLAKLEAAEKRAEEMTEQYLDRNTALSFVTLRAEAAEARLLVPVIRQQHAEWSNATFGNVGPIGPLKHLSKEALETAAAPNDLSEWADMQFLFWDAQRRAGITDEQLEQAMIEKLEINKSRTWPEPKDGEPREHIKAGFKVEGNTDAE